MSFKNKQRIISTLFVAVVILFFVPVFASASNFDYKLLESIPGFVNAGEKSPGFNTYIEYVYKFAIWVVGICALLMISIGAFMYLTSAGNNAAMSSAKTVITNAIAGLILALVSYLILYTINPELVSPKGVQESQEAKKKQLQPGELSNEAATKLLKEAGIEVVPTPGGYTTLQGIPQEAIDGIIKIKKDTGIAMQLTGGTETTGHKTHGPGKPIVDIQILNSSDKTKMNSYLKNNREKLGIKTIYSSSGYTDKKVKEPDRVYHIEFK